jgi:cytidine deaminase
MKNPKTKAGSRKAAEHAILKFVKPADAVEREQRARELVELAKQARRNAHAPFSRFRVGAVVECSDGRLFTGCNVENSSYGLSMCAERVAIFKAVSEGARQFKRIAVVADTDGPVHPCGACRQVISDLFGVTAEVIMGNLNGHLEIKRVDELLPEPFDRSALR